MINVVKAKEKCCEDISLIENYDAAIADTTQTWWCHHRLGVRDGVTVTDELIANNMYEHRPASELIFVTPSQHAKLHADACSKGGKKAGPKNIKIMRAKLTHEILSKGGQKGVKNQPREAKVRGGKNGGKKAGKMTKGKSWWNNGKSGTLAFECPGEDWVRGRLKKGH